LLHLALQRFDAFCNEMQRIVSFCFVHTCAPGGCRRIVTTKENKCAIQKLWVRPDVHVMTTRRA
jgi:hypothetical protein